MFRRFIIINLVLAGVLLVLFGLTVRHYYVTTDRVNQLAVECDATYDELWPEEDAEGNKLSAWDRLRLDVDPEAKADYAARCDRSPQWSAVSRATASQESAMKNGLILFAGAILFPFWFLILFITRWMIVGRWSWTPPDK